jgi:hypothetical protein
LNFGAIFLILVVEARLSGKVEEQGLFVKTMRIRPYQFSRLKIFHTKIFLIPRFLSVICGYPHFKQLFRRHKKQFSDLFLEFDNKFMIEIYSNTCDKHLLTEIVPKTTQNIQLNKLIS